MLTVFSNRMFCYFFIFSVIIIICLPYSVLSVPKRKREKGREESHRHIRCNKNPNKHLSQQFKILKIFTVCNI